MESQASNTPALLCGFPGLAPAVALSLVSDENLFLVQIPAPALELFAAQDTFSIISPHIPAEVQGAVWSLVLNSAQTCSHRVVSTTLWPSEMWVHIHCPPPAKISM